MPTQLKTCSKVSFKEDILGIGIRAIYHGDHTLKYTHLTLDVMSLTAFNQGLRMGVWKEEIHYFLPLVIDADHGERALPLIEAVLMWIAGADPPPLDSRAPPKPYTWTTRPLPVGEDIHPRGFNAETALRVMCVTMNSLVVSIMNQLESTGTPPLHASEKALQGYAYMHHMLLFLASKHPRMVTLANEKVNRFIQTEDGTDKKFTPFV